MLSTTNMRTKQLEELDNFLNNSKKKLSAIVSTLGWSFEEISKDVEKMIVCPFNKLHSIPEKSLIRHLEECEWKAEGYGVMDLPLSSPTLLPGTSRSIKFDEQLQDDVIQIAKQQNPAMITGAGGRLIPRTSDRLIAEFTRDERLAMYEYVIANTAQPDIGEDITDMNKPKASDGKTSSYLELLAQERNLKRRRAKYRGVHTNKKSQVEILREVINQQMEMLAEYISEKNDDATNEGDDFPINRDTSKDEILHNSHFSTNTERSVTDKTEFRLVDGDGRHHQSRTSNDCGSDKGNNGFRDCYSKTDISKEKSKYSDGQSQRERNRRVSSDQIIHTSSQKSHKHRSRDRHEERHKRHRSKDRKTSRSSRDSKHDERRTEAARHLKHDDRRSKKRRRSRDH